MDITIDKLDAILDQLKGIRIKEVLSLRKRLEKEKQKLAPKEIEIKIPKEKLSANQKRSSKLSRYWRYVKLIRDNFPNLRTSVHPAPVGPPGTKKLDTKTITAIKYIQ